MSLLRISCPKKMQLNCCLLRTPSSCIRLADLGCWLVGLGSAGDVAEGQ